MVNNHLKIFYFLFTIHILIFYGQCQQGNCNSQTLPRRVCNTCIYQELWNIDMKNNGLKAGIGGSESTAPLLIFENTKVKQSPSYNLMVINNETLLDKPTYELYEALNDFYNIKPEKKESYSSSELKLIWDFLDEIMKTEVMIKAYSFLVLNNPTKDSGFMCIKANDKELFKKQLFHIWFELFINHYKEKKRPDVSGFEHVFVGEHGAKKFKQNAEIIGGYHFWYQYYLAEKECHGVRYEGINYSEDNYERYDQNLEEAGLKNPEVATFQMTWDPPKETQQSSSRKGFFVGLSPEGLMALGTVAFFQSKWKCSEQLKDVVINNQHYKLVLHRNTLEKNSKKDNKEFGDHIVSFYPVYLGKK